MTAYSVSETYDNCQPESAAALDTRVAPSRCRCRNHRFVSSWPTAPCPSGVWTTTLCVWCRLDENDYVRPSDRLQRSGLWTKGSVDRTGTSCFHGVGNGWWPLGLVSVISVPCPYAIQWVRVDFIALVSFVQKLPLISS